MNTLIKTLGSLAILLFVFSSNAQKLEFDELVHDFGTIKEEEGSVTPLSNLKIRATSH
jgi:hypothetical protein